MTFSNILAIKAANFRLSLRKSDCRYHYDVDERLFYVKDGNVKHYFSNLKRGLTLYKRGLERRSSQILSSYNLDKIAFNNSDIVIDCGANYGDLWLALRNQIDSRNYISFEPGYGEYRAICKNIIGGRNYNAALADADENRAFYVNEQDADSSIIEPQHYSEIRQVEAMRLDTFLLQNSINRVKLLKLEAEGFEPEVLDGARNSISKIQYVAIDGGNERGLAQEETFSSQTNFLTSNGFEMRSVNLRWGRALFKNKCVAID